MKPEPVAWRWKDGDSEFMYGAALPLTFSRSRHAWQPLYPASALEAVRRQALEEAAKVCGELRHHNWSSESDDWIAGTDHCAAAIRALIDKENGNEA